MKQFSLIAAGVLLSIGLVAFATSSDKGGNTPKCDPPCCKVESCKDSKCDKTACLTSCDPAACKPSQK